MKKIKIGLITFHASHNCGSILQAYALQQTLMKRYNANVEIINFINKGQHDMYSLYLKNKNAKNIFKNLLYFGFFKIYKRGYSRYDEYIRKHLILSKGEYHEIEQLGDIENDYDVFVCGSDQIWNITCRDADDAYFLPYIKNKTKIAYAPSLGSRSIRKYAGENINNYVNYLKSIDFLSVREFNSQRWLKDLVPDRKVEVLPDPTMLLDKEDYEKIENDSKIKDDYIFYYSYAYTPEENAVVHKISKMLNCQVIMLNAKKWINKKLGFKNIKVPRYEDPGVFINLMKNAKMVITTSFHGVVFSSLFEKDFWVLKTGEMQGDDDRVYTLLKQINMLDRFFIMDKEISDSELIKKIDYGKINYKENLKNLRSKAFNYLDRALEKDLMNEE